MAQVISQIIYPDIVFMQQTRAYVNQNFQCPVIESAIPLR